MSDYQTSVRNMGNPQTIAVPAAEKARIVAKAAARSVARGNDREERVSVFAVSNANTVTQLRDDINSMKDFFRKVYDAEPMIQ